ncbi:biotin--[acetyl-CoA-carboxylase] ligase [Giesbergeria anulus]|uniref:BirA family transcriptional regulator, biotin operon repressor / biotin-[acetyl-CoA-carboxylase] ligase n=1 Tax=Giesbergeria anulus TaxID=180197 RepID=A0A1H9MFK0_9BURK|nr:biotin--[acetyl-CoA-carboxylase] ligase [Giesbergeria anulus]SER22496.1 BirA family transcriptional regulator, biotin operon repressor / biotin-[acetyl-CoA-carboxylase] ligase [Giesbergeria anulus]
MSAPLRWPAEALWEAIAPQWPGFTVEVLPSIDSSNTELMRRARSGQYDPILLVAEEQTAGRGRLGRQWQGQPGDTLMFSLGLPLAPRDWSGLSLAVGVSVAESLQPVLPPAGSSQPRLSLKWPNDLWLCNSHGERKLGGILVETASFVAPQTQVVPMHTSPATRYVVIGIGLNLRPPDHSGLSLPAAGLQEIDAHIDAPAALLRVVPPLLAMLQAFEHYGFGPVQARFDLRDALQNRSVVLSDGQTGTAHGVGEDGALRVMTAQGMQCITSAEISVRPASAAATLPA